MKKRLITLTSQRVVDELDENNPLRFLYNIDTAQLIDIAVEKLYMFTRDKKRTEQKLAMLTEVAVSIGNRVRASMHKDTALSVKAGVFLLYSFEKAGITKVDLGQGTGDHATYIIKILDDEALTKLWGAVEINKTEKLPSTVPIPPWTRNKDFSGINIVKTNSKVTLESISPELQPVVFDAINKLQSVPWQINTQVYEAATWALRNRADAFSDIWAMQNEEAKQSKLRETHAIAGLAKRFLGKTFYHLHTLDFRGRIYTSTAYLSHQGTDFSKGLLIRADLKEIGEQGLYWLLVSIASYWGGDAGRPDGAKTDKIPLQDRVLWVLKNEPEILSYAIDFKKNKDWFNADKPWQFLAACFELKKLREWQVFMKATRGANYNQYGYKSGFTGWLDG